MLFMSRIIILIPCFNEADHLPSVIGDLRSNISAIGSFEICIIDDGSTDNTIKVAKDLGVNHIFCHLANRGLAKAFASGISEALSLGGDIIVNFDADNQYRAADIVQLIEPILLGKADIVIGNRPIWKISHFSFLKKILQTLGSKIVCKLAGLNNIDCTSGFRAFSRDAAIKLSIVSTYTYTLESLLQARMKGLKVVSVPIEINPPKRPSRLMKSTTSYIIRSAATILRLFTMYHPLRVFGTIGVSFGLLGFLVGLRFVYFYLTDGGTGHVQSLIFTAICLVLGTILVITGIVADLIHFNRLLLEQTLERVKRKDYKKYND